MIRIGIVGCGTIGSALAKAIQKKFRKIARLAYVSDRNPPQIEKLRRLLKSATFKSVSIDTLIKRSNLIIEAASVEAAKQIIPKVLRSGKDILTLSVGGILLIPNLKRLLVSSRGHVFIPSGAVAGIDGILAAKEDHIRSIDLTTRKPLRSLKRSPFFLKNRSHFMNIKKPTLIFEGSALEAIRYFPENINVAATLSLAGIGPRRTCVRIFTSPTFHRNTHEIKVDSRFGKMFFQLINVPSKANPKTSALAVGSAIAMLDKILGKLKIGT